VSNSTTSSIDGEIWATKIGRPNLAGCLHHYCYSTSAVHQRATSGRIAFVESCAACGTNTVVSARKTRRAQHNSTIADSIA